MTKLWCKDMVIELGHEYETMAVELGYEAANYLAMENYSEDIHKEWPKMMLKDD